MKAAQWLGVLALGLTLAGCATIISGSSQLITVNSNVEGAEVYLNDQMLGTTPLSVDVKRGQEGLLRITHEGYQPYSIALNKHLNNVFFGNILSGGVFGSSTDYSTGAMYSYEPSTFMVNLQPGNLSAAEITEWQRREGLRRFVLVNHQAIVSDLAAGSGEYLDVLVEVFEGTSESLAADVARWREVYAGSETVLEFADRMVAELN
jgi:hypothetical protein